jgi:transposase
VAYAPVATVRQATAPGQQLGHTAATTVQVPTPDGISKDGRQPKATAIRGDRRRLKAGIRCLTSPESAMASHQKDPLRPLTPDERRHLEHLTRSRTDPAAQVTRATELLAVADGVSFESAARQAGRKSGDAVAHLVARFNRDGMAAIGEHHGGGQPKRYTETEQERIVREARRTPDRDKDGTATWSLTTLQRALRRAPDGLPDISTYTIWCVLHDAGFVWTKDRSWCEMGTVVRKRKSGTVTVVDPDATPKKT